MAFGFIKQFGDDAAVKDGFENRVMVCDFARPTSRIPWNVNGCDAEV